VNVKVFLPEYVLYISELLSTKDSTASSSLKIMIYKTKQNKVLGTVGHGRFELNSRFKNSI